MNNALATLFYAFDDLADQSARDHASVLFLGARAHPALKNFPALACQQHFKPYAAELEASGLNVQPLAEECTASPYDLVFLLAPKNVIETSYLIALGIRALKNGGRLICAADNKAGGTRLEKMLFSFGLTNVQSLSKNKARAAWGIKESASLNQQALDDAIQNGQPRPVTGTNFLSVPGIFGWQKIDRGSALLLETINQSLKGTGADFGCGYGYLARPILSEHDVRQLFCIDADYRAVELCKHNTNQHAQYVWADLTRPVADLPPLDFIIMNPPFHEGRKSDSDIGQAFITSAAGALKKGGVLWMVANTHLPYESALKEHFTSYEERAKDKGFKVFKAIR